jgi:hypothetical protein
LYDQFVFYNNPEIESCYSGTILFRYCSLYIKADIENTIFIY